MTDPLTLAQQAETASPEETRGLLEKAWSLLAGGETPFKRSYAFYRLLDINTQEAFLGAAAMLVPEGTMWLVTNVGDDNRKPVLGRSTAFAGQFDQATPGDPIEAATPALSLLCAILRAEAAKQEKV